MLPLPMPKALVAGRESRSAGTATGKESFVAKVPHAWEPVHKYGLRCIAAYERVICIPLE